VKNGFKLIEDSFDSKKNLEKLESLIAAKN
jgi:hypothetical protein